MLLAETSVTLISVTQNGWLKSVKHSRNDFRLMCCLENYICFVFVPVRDILQKHPLSVHQVSSVTDIKTTVDVAGCRGRCKLAVC